VAFRRGADAKHFAREVGEAEPGGGTCCNCSRTGLAETCRRRVPRLKHGGQQPAKYSAGASSRALRGPNAQGPRRAVAARQELVTGENWIRALPRGSFRDGLSRRGHRGRLVGGRYRGKGKPVLRWGFRISSKSQYDRRHLVVLRRLWPSRKMSWLKRDPVASMNPFCEQPQ